MPGRYPSRSPTDYAPDWWDAIRAMDSPKYIVAGIGLIVVVLVITR